MIDISQIAGTISQLVGGNAAPDAIPTALTDAVQQVGLDPNALQGLSHEQILGLLMEHGVDPSTLEGLDLTGLAAGLGHHENVVGAAVSWLNVGKTDY